MGFVRPQILIGEKWEKRKVELIQLNLRKNYLDFQLNFFNLPSLVDSKIFNQYKDEMRSIMVGGNKFINCPFIVAGNVPFERLSFK